MADRGGNVAVHRIEHRRHPGRQRLVEPRLAAHDEVLALAARPRREVLGKGQAVPGTLVVRIKFHRAPQCGEGLSIAAGLHLEQPELRDRRAPARGTACGLTQRLGRLLILARERQEPSALVVSKRRTGHQAVERVEACLHRGIVEAHAFGGRAQRECLPLGGHALIKRLKRCDRRGRIARLQGRFRIEQVGEDVRFAQGAQHPGRSPRPVEIERLHRHATKQVHRLRRAQVARQRFAKRLDTLAKTVLLD